MRVKYPDNWIGIESMDSSRIKSIELELQKEVHAAHPLYGKKYLLLAMRLDQDDVFLHSAIAGKWAITHLTWSGKMEKMTWPHTVIFDTLAKAWIHLVDDAV